MCHRVWLCAMQCASDTFSCFSWTGVLICRCAEASRRSQHWTITVVRQCSLGVLLCASWRRLRVGSSGVQIVFHCFGRATFGPPCRAPFHVNWFSRGVCMGSWVPRGSAALRVTKDKRISVTCVTKIGRYVVTCILERRMV